MLLLTRLSGKQFFINPELILTIEETPNTVITLQDHTTIVVKEPAAVVVEQYLAYRQKVNRPFQQEADANT